MIDERLLGRWESVTGVGQDPVTIEFTVDGSLTYTIHAPGTNQQMFLRYSIEDGVIITDQPSHPREERTAYRITSDGRLVMTNSGEQSVFVRQAAS